jgi:hypothetical protein
MPVLSIAETVTRPASVALDAWFPTSGTVAVGHARRAALVTEQLQVGAAIAETVARMGVELDADRLDALTDETATLLARAEELRLALALAIRAGNDSWLATLELD